MCVEWLCNSYCSAESNIFKSINIEEKKKKKKIFLYYVLKQLLNNFIFIMLIDFLTLNTLLKF